MPRRVREARQNPLLLDTHVWIWLMEDVAGRLSSRCLAEIRVATRAGRLFVSPVSAWEVAMLVAKGRLTLRQDVRLWVSDAIGMEGLYVAAFTVQVALDAALLPGAPRADRADRFLIATARALGATLVTRDRAMLEYGSAGHVAVLDAGA